MSEATPVPDDLVLHAAFVRRLARSLLRDEHGAEDVAQDALKRALERPPATELRRWLASLTRSLVQRRWRSDSRRGARERRGARPEAQPSADKLLAREETLQRVVDAVRALEEPYRTLVLARFYEDLPPREIARREGIPVETVHTRLQRALARMRRTLARGEDDYRDALGLLAGSSPCLPPHAGDDVLSIPIPAPIGALVVGVVVAVAALVVKLSLDEAMPDDARGVAAALAEASGAGPGSLSGRSRREPVGALAPQTALSGRVLDEGGAAVPEARVLVLASEDPFGPPEGAGVGWNHLTGRSVACDGEGSWRAELPEAQRVFVVLDDDPTFEPVEGSGEGRWVDAPAQGIDLRVRRVPFGTIDVRVLEGPAHREIEGFKVAVHGETTVEPSGATSYRGYMHAPSDGSRWTHAWSLRDGLARRVHVVLMEPEVSGPWTQLMGKTGRLRQEIELVPGETERVVFVLPERGVLRGQVVDSAGLPVAGALVYFGPGTRARGDEPFRPFRPERILDGARTGPDGWFELRGAGGEVTAWHAEHSAVSVPVERAGLVALPARGALRGRLVTPGGQAIAGAELHLDERGRGPVVTTDADGRFDFGAVEACAHGLWLGREILLGVHVGPGEEADVELGAPAGGHLSLALRASAPPDLTGARGVLIGCERLFGMYEVSAPSPGALAVDRRVLPGRYWLATDRGWVAPVTVPVGAEEVPIDLGAAELRVRAGTARRLQLVPHDANALVALVAARVPLRIAANSEGLFRVLPGRYRVVTEAGAIVSEVDVPPSGVTLELD